MAGFDFPGIAQGFGDNQPLPDGDSGSTIQRMILCDKTVLGLPALVVAVIGGILLWAIFDYIFSFLFAASSIIDFINALVRIAGILIISYVIQKFERVRNMYSGMWPCGFHPDSQGDPAATAVSKVIGQLGGLKEAACKVGGLYQLAQSVGGLPVLIKSYGGLACMIDEYGTFEDFVCAIGGTDKLHEQLPGQGDLYAAMGATNPNDIPMPMDDSQAPA